jgi:aminoglycoside phosphotransferase (APT) family kinase protein
MPGSRTGKVPAGLPLGTVASIGDAVQTAALERHPLMTQTSPHDLRAVACQFQIYGEFRHAEPYGTGHINDTYAAHFDQGGTPVRYILQRINHKVFQDPPALMENIRRVTTHLGNKLAGERDFSRRALTLIPARDGSVFHRDGAGNYWRAYLFIEKARTYDALQSPEQAFQAARAFGHFQQLLLDLPAPPLHETIVGFHDTPRRFAQLEQAIGRDAVNRARFARAEIDFALHRKDLTGRLLAAGLPERITHNDTKLSNVMLDDDTGEGICITDLDTVMPGLALYDFGDMVRTGTSPALEDERDLSKTTMQFPMFEALVRGYLASAGGFLTKAEREYLAFAGKLITFEMGIRFLADFLAGDVYYKVRHDTHNLDRCRTQFRLIESLEQQEEQMNRFVGAM